MKSCGIDIEKKLTDMLSAELTKTIDSEILKNLFDKRFKRMSKINKIFKFSV